MTTRTILFAVAGLVLLVPGVAQSDPGKAAYEQGRALLSQGDFQGAMESFATAVRTDRTNQEYLQNHSIVRQVLMLRAALDTEQDPQRWEYYARALHTYYLGEAIYDEALALDHRIHQKLGTAASAALLAETQLAMNLNAEAAEVLASLGPEKSTVVTQSLLGIALVRLGRKEEAGRIAATIEPAADSGPGLVYCIARLKAATGNGPEAAALLTRCFEQVPPSQLESFKSHAKATPEFVSLAATPEFQKSLKTESKVSESACSGGSSCAGCPMRGGCSKDPGK